MAFTFTGIGDNVTVSVANGYIDFILHGPQNTVSLKYTKGTEDGIVITPAELFDINGNVYESTFSRDTAGTFSVYSLTLTASTAKHFTLVLGGHPGSGKRRFRLNIAESGGTPSGTVAAFVPTTKVVSAAS